MKKVILFFTAIIILASCDYYDNTLKIKNQSRNPIAIEECYDLDSVFFNNVEYYLSNVIEPDSVKNLTVQGKVGTWRKLINNSRQRKIYILIFDVDTLKKYKQQKTMYDLFAHEKYVKRLEFSADDLDKINWQITFNAKNIGR